MGSAVLCSRSIMQVASMNSGWAPAKWDESSHRMFGFDAGIGPAQTGLKYRAYFDQGSDVRALVALWYNYKAQFSLFHPQQKILMKLKKIK